MLAFAVKVLEIISVLRYSIFKEHYSRRWQGSRILVFPAVWPGRAAVTLSFVASIAAKALTSAGYVSLVGAPGFEPGTSALSGLRSSQLSYAPVLSRSIEPVVSVRLALAGLHPLVETIGIEPTTSAVQGLRSPS